MTHRGVYPGNSGFPLLVLLKAPPNIQCPNFALNDRFDPFQAFQALYVDLIFSVNVASAI